MSGARYAQFCALARAAEVLCERWTLLIVRELLLGPRRFVDLSARLAGVSPTLLTARLNGLVEAGVVARKSLPPPYSAQVYELTPVGRALRPAVMELIRWGGNFLFPMRADDEFEPEWGLLALEAVARRTPTPAHRIVVRIRHRALQASYVVEGGKAGTTIVQGEGPGSATIATGFDTLLRIVAAQLPLERAISGKLATVEGSMRVARALPALFDLSRSGPGRAASRDAGTLVTGDAPARR